MKRSRRWLVALTTALLRLTLVFGLSVLAVLPLLTQPQQLEKNLNTSGAYNSFVPAVLQTLSSSNSGGGIPFNDKGVQQIVNNAFPPQLLRSSSETIIDSIYGWLDGSRPTLKYRVDLTKNRDLMTENITSYAFNRLTSYPLCKDNPPLVDPFVSTCLPANFSIANERAAFRSSVNQLLSKTVYTPDDLPRLSNGKSLARDYPQAPHYFTWFKRAPIIFGSLVVLLTGLLLWFAGTWRKGIKQLASIYISSGIALIVTPILYEIIYPHISQAFRFQSASKGINVLLDTLIKQLTHGIYSFLIAAALILINLGIIIRVMEYLSRHASEYKNLEAKSGLTTSHAKRKITEDKQLELEDIPLQTSEQIAQPAHKKRKLGGNHGNPSNLNKMEQALGKEE